MKRMKNEMKVREARLNALVKPGYKIQHVEKVCNNIIMDGYSIVDKNQTPSVGPVIYYDSKWYEKPDLEVVQFLESYLNDLPQFDYTDLLSKEYILSNVLPIVVDLSNEKNLKTSNYVFIKRDPFLVLFYVDVEFIEGGHIKLTKNMLELTDITVDDLYFHAIHHLEQQIEIKPMFQVLFEMNTELLQSPELTTQILESFGLPDDAVKSFFSDLKTNSSAECIQKLADSTSHPMYVISNRDNSFGAAAILCSSVYNVLSQHLGEKFIILPSSIHECATRFAA